MSDQRGMREALEALVSAADTLGDVANSSLCDNALRMARAALAAQPPAAPVEDDPFRRAEVEAICRAVCKVESVDPDDDTFGDGCDPAWTRYADAVFAALPPVSPSSAGSADPFKAEAVEAPELDQPALDAIQRIVDWETRSEVMALSGAWCQPMDCGKHTPRKFLLYFEDTDRGIAVFDNEAEAREAFTKANTAWNCYLFGALPLYAAQPPAAPVSGVMRAAEKAAKVVAGWSDAKRDYAERAMGGERSFADSVTVREVLASLYPIMDSLEAFRGDKNILRISGLVGDVQDVGISTVETTREAIAGAVKVLEGVRDRPQSTSAAPVDYATATIKRAPELLDAAEAALVARSSADIDMLSKARRLMRTALIDAKCTSPDTTYTQEGTESLVNVLVAAIAPMLTGPQEVKEALEFYADPTRYNGPNGRLEGESDKYQPEGLYYRLDVTRDGGRLARRALAVTRPKSGG